MSHDPLDALLALPGTRARLDLDAGAHTVTCWPPAPGDPADTDLRVDARDVVAEPGERGRLRRPDRRGLAVLDVEVLSRGERWLLLRAVDTAVVQRRRHTRASTGRARIRPAARVGPWPTGTARHQLLRLLDLSESGLRVLVPQAPPAVGTAVQVQLVLGESDLADLLVVRGTVHRHDAAPDGTVVAVHLDESLPGRTPDRIRAAVLRAQGAAARRNREGT